MKIYSVYDPEFNPYGKVIDGYDTSELMEKMLLIDMPDKGTCYEPGIEALESCEVYSEFRNRAYGGMPVQIGMCWGYNTRLNCLEYHRDSEINVGTEDYILLLARMEDITDGHVDTSVVKAFRAPAGAAVQIYETTLHYAPCHVDENKGFRNAVILPRGTNTAKPTICNGNREDELLFACNKWLIAHPDSDEASKGAFVGLSGDNIDVSGLIEQ